VNIYCFRSKHPQQISVPAGGDFLYQCELTIHGAGSFDFGMDLYLADPDLRTVTLTVRGVGIASKGSKHDKPTS
jgi:hypothetical protein